MTTEETRRVLHTIWRRMGFWGVAWIAWGLVFSTARLAMIERHRAQPGNYNAPEKAAIRRQWIVTGAFGSLVLLSGFVVHLVRQKPEEPPRRQNTPELGGG